MACFYLYCANQLVKHIRIGRRIQIMVTDKPALVFQRQFSAKNLRHKKVVTNFNLGQQKRKSKKKGKIVS